MAKFRILVLTDSRGRFLSNHIWREMRHLNMIDIDCSVRYFPGATVSQVAERGIRHIERHGPYDVIYMCAGVNDLTAKLGPRNIVPSFDSVNDIVSKLYNEILINDNWLYSHYYIVSTMNQPANWCYCIVSTLEQPANWTYISSLQ